EHYGQATVITCARLRDHTVDDFPLQHEMLVDYRLGMVGQVEKKRTGNVVGQIADNAYALTHGSKIDRQNVGLNNFQTLLWPCLAKRSRKIAVQLDHSQPIQ